MAILETRQNYRQIILRKLEILSERVIPKRDLTVEFDWDPLLNGMKLELREEIWTERLQDTAHELRFAVSYPATWWQHFKQTCFPTWLKRRFPIQRKVVSQVKKIQFVRSAVFPEFRYKSVEKERPFVIKETLEWTGDQSEFLTDEDLPDILIERTVENGKVFDIIKTHPNGSK